MIESKEQAITHVERNYPWVKKAVKTSLAVSEDGSVHVNCDLSTLEGNIHILVGELPIKKSKK